jgi:hypothetical protein
LYKYLAPGRKKPPGAPQITIPIPLKDPGKSEICPEYPKTVRELDIFPFS